MTNELQKLLDKAANVAMSPQAKEEQRLSFAYGSAKIENDDITREMIEKAAQKMR